MSKEAHMVTVHEIEDIPMDILMTLPSFSVYPAVREDGELDLYLSTATESSDIAFRALLQLLDGAFAECDWAPEGGDDPFAMRHRLVRTTTMQVEEDE